MTRPLLVLVLCLLSMLPAGAQAGTLSYPDAEKPIFLLDYPDTWDLTEPDGDDAYATLMSQGGTMLMARRVEGTKEGGKAAIDDLVAYIEETYKDVQVDPPEAINLNGFKGAFSAGSGRQEDGSKVGFSIMMYDLGNGHGVEMWFVTSADDEEGHTGAKGILNSFRVP